MVDMNKPTVIYLTSQTNDWEDLIALDISELGTFYSFLLEVESLDQEDAGHNPISIAIVGFEENKKLLTRFKLYMVDRR